MASISRAIAIENMHKFLPTAHKKLLIRSIDNSTRDRNFATSFVQNGWHNEILQENTKVGSQAEIYIN